VRTGPAIGVRLVGATQKPNGLTMGDRENCSDWHQITSLNAVGTHCSLQLIAARDHNIHSHSATTALRLFIADSTQSRRPRALNHQTFLVHWHRCGAPACSDIGEIAHRSKHPFHTALILSRLVLPSPIPLRVDTRQRSTTRRSSLIGIGAELLLARTSDRSPIVPDTRFTRCLSSVLFFCLAPHIEALVEYFYC
jgi:hypothetical protein